MGHVASWIWVLIPITAIVCGVFGGVARRWIRLKEREMRLSSEMTAEKAAQYAAHTERLEQRVRVLERIVTDKGIAISDEIERLRDERPH
jgi:ABC-type phosphate transport system auxiliary subunit